MPFDEKHFEEVLLEVKRHLEDTEVSKLAHWNAAAVYERRHTVFIGLPATLLSVLLTWLLSAGFRQILANDSSIQILTKQVPVFLSLAVSILSGLGTFLNFRDLAIKHRNAAENLHSLWRDCKNWGTDFPDETTCEKAVQMVQQYRRRINDINRDAPQIPKWAWKSVSRQKEEGSTIYKTDSNQSLEEENIIK